MVWTAFKLLATISFALSVVELTVIARTPQDVSGRRCLRASPVIWVAIHHVKLNKGWKSGCASIHHFGEDEAY